MGYKLAGYDVLGFNEIDKKQADCYLTNLNPKYSFVCDIRELINKKLPDELFNLDILDGSPPCTPFSVAGEREKIWGVKKKFREGQEEQIIDDLSFYFLELGDKLKPKIIIIENVPGMLIGNAIKYIEKIQNQLSKMNYDFVKIILDASRMGVPQKRRRLFIFAIRKDLNYQKMGLLRNPKLDMKFNQKIIPFREIEEENSDRPLLGENTKYRRAWELAKSGESLDVYRKNNLFNWKKSHPNFILPAIISNSQTFHYVIPRKLSDPELILGGSFPIDYNFLGNNVQYCIGMSVPPVMMANIAWNIKQQWLGE